MQSSDGTAVIVDENSILRNHILVKSYMLGGSGERWVPPMVIEEVTSASMVIIFFLFVSMDCQIFILLVQMYINV